MRVVKRKTPRTGKTTFVTRNNKKWFLIDADGKTLGRMASVIKTIITGKHSVNYSENMDHGDGVVVINAKKVFLSGNKRNNKQYYSYSSFIGSDKTTPFSVMIDKKPEEVIRRAVKGMMRRGSLANSQIKNLRVFADDKHDMMAQNPEAL